MPSCQITRKLDKRFIFAEVCKINAMRQRFNIGRGIRLHEGTLHL